MSDATPNVISLVAKDGSAIRITSEAFKPVQTIEIKSDDGSIVFVVRCSVDSE